MKPKNASERSKSFIKFLILYFATTATVVAAVYFNYRVPEKENQILREQTEISSRDMDYQRVFFDEMKSVIGMIDSLGPVNTSASGMQNQLISTKLGDMKTALPVKDSTHLYEMHNSIIQVLVKLQDSKQRLNELTDAEGRITSLMNQLDDCEEDLKTAERLIRSR